MILGTTGQTIQAEADVLDLIDEAGTRSIVLIDRTGAAAIPQSAIRRIAALSTVEWVIGLGQAQDATNSAIGSGATRVAVRVIHGDLPGPPVLQHTPWHRQPGTALVGSEASGMLGLSHPAGGVDIDPWQLAVVGSFVANEPLTFLNQSILAAPSEKSDEQIRSIYVVARTPQDVAGLTDVLPELAGAVDRSGLALETSEALAAVRTAVAGELGRYGRNLVSLVLGVGLLLVGLNVYGAVTSKRRDFGRRRALGASRADIVQLVALQTVSVALVGAAAGLGIGAALVWRWTGDAPETGFTVAVGVLAVLAALAASLPPAIVAAFRDPVRVLRVP
ncbi:MAG: ABC transporter permease [Acidimicrobiia bacterium]|nr:ABC transporter permease [Acidimicrobiia bacterium]NNF08952.1 ABC transporter permease [Acidimicrobiia bacterium]NNL71344.1 ABC transporter permease [Acidimicrobiia bacterium]